MWLVLSLYREHVHLYRLFPDILTISNEIRIRLSLNPNGIVDTSNGANLRPTPLRDSRYTFRL